MESNRLEAFSDGVLAIIITIMVLELKVPHGEAPDVLLPLWPVALSYLLSFIYVGIYWNNHHHMFKAAQHVNGTVLWSNLLLLFWLSLLPFSTGWLGENHFARWPAILYGINLLLCALSYYVLQTTLVRYHGVNSLLARAIGKDVKGKISPIIYSCGVGAAWLGYPFIAIAFYVSVAAMWLIPDRRFEKVLIRE